MASIQLEGQQAKVGNEIAVADQNTTSPTPNTTLYFQAVGLVRGQYFPSTETFNKGVLLLDDGVMAPTNLLSKAAYLLQGNSELLGESQIWIVYPRTRIQNPPYLNFAARALRLPEADEDLEAIDRNIDYFTIRGIVTYIDRAADKFVVRIYRNAPKGEPPAFLELEKDEPQQILTIKGVLPESAYGQFWELHVHRIADQLFLKQATFIAQVFKPKKSKKPTTKQRHKKGKGKVN